MSNKKIATLKDVSGGGGGGGRPADRDSGGESSDEGESFFVGGSESSGNMVLGPGRPANNDPADRLFRLARDHGAESVDPNEEQPQGGNRPFGAGGVRLGDLVQPSQRVDPAAAPDAGDPQEVQVTLVTYDNGFTVGDGEFRAFNDPASAAFLNEIASGRLPRELLTQYPGQRVAMRMERRGGEYAPPKVRVFAGSGHRLGAVVPEVVNVEAPPPAPAAPSVDEAAKLLKAAQDAVTLDEKQKPTQLQIRLPDNRRLVAKFNPTSTITDVRAFVVTAAPQLAFSAFELRTSYPNAPITDESRTLTAASLLNSVIIVRQT